MSKLIAYFRVALKNRAFLKAFRAVEARSKEPYEMQKQRQLEQLNRLLTHAYEKVPYYHKLLSDLNLVQNNRVRLKRVSDLEKIPFLTKDIIRKEGERLYASDHKNRLSYSNSSGGSTGEPVTFLQDAHYRKSNQLQAQLTYAWRGLGLYDDMVVIWGAERDIFEGKKSWRGRLEDLYLSRTVLNSFSMDEGEMRNYLQVLNRKRPKLIKAYAQSIYELAKFAKKEKIDVAPQQAIHLAAGTVYPSMRHLIEEVFSSQTYNHYGSREVGAIASECAEQNGLHIMMEHTLVEVINEEGAPCQVGEQGEIVVTTLENHSMPLIRYRIGDIGILQAYQVCGCGCGYPKLEKIVGRTTDLFKTRDGKKIDGEYFTHLFYFRAWVEQFQVIQEDLDRILIKVVTSEAPPQSDLLEIEKKIKLVMGTHCEVTFEFVTTIPKTVTGKFRYTLSKL